MISGELTKKIEIPEGAIVNCPKEKNAMIRICIKCVVCDYYTGIMKVQAEGRFDLANRLVCAHPMTRSIGLVLEV